MRGRLMLTAAGLLLAIGVNRAHAVVTAAAPLQKFEGDAVYILVGKVEKHLPDKPAMVVTAIEDIKGKAPFRTLPINCKIADPKTFKDNQIEPLLKRFGPDLEIIFFFTPRGAASYTTYAFANGTWFQLRGTKVDGDRVVFGLLSAEPYFRKSFRGTTAELRQLLKDHAAGKAKLPPLDDKIKPGFGPEYAPKKGARAADPHESLRSSWGLCGSGQLFAVIPTLGIGAPLAILALLFPTLFGGVFVLFRQWLAFITAISVNSTLMFVHLFATAKYFRGEFWGTDAALWLVMTIVTVACLFWAWRRQLDLLAAGEREVSRRAELAILLFMSAGSVAAAIITWRIAGGVSWSDAGWALTIVLTAGVLAGTLYRGFHTLKSEPLFGSPPLATEGVILAVILAGHVLFVPLIWGGNVGTEGSVIVHGQTGETNANVSAVAKKWDFTVEPRIRGMYAAPPVVAGDAIFASYSDTTQYATLVRLDRHTGVKKWEFFGKNDDLRQMISTPCYADGKLYFGEGFHFDKNCHVFCVDAQTGEEVWRFKTNGQTESSPAVVNGRVYIGAGNDGVYCLDAKTGAKIWRFFDVGNERIQRFGGGMRVVGDKLYCGTGVDREHPVEECESAVFCFNADTGALLWKTPAPYPVWSTPVIRDGTIYVTSGNGDVFTDAEPPQVPGGALQCLDTSGKELWRVKLNNGVIDSPAVDGHRIYFGCRDGQIYCVNRGDGKERWKRFLESPVIAAPMLDSDPALGRTVSVFAVAAAGKVFCMNPRTGDDVWTYTPTAPGYVSASPRLVVTRTPQGFRRQLYIGCGLGGGTRDIVANRPVFYCLEDHVNVE